MLNRGLRTCIADGRCDDTPYHPEILGWMLHYSPDFEINKTSAAGIYQVTTDPEEAYRYVWDVSSLTTGASTMSVRLSHTGAGMGYPIRLRLKLP